MMADVKVPKQIFQFSIPNLPVKQKPMHAILNQSPHKEPGGQQPQHFNRPVLRLEDLCYIEQNRPSKRIEPKRIKTNPGHGLKCNQQPTADLGKIKSYLA